jgi:hypothetical protein
MPHTPLYEQVIPNDARTTLNADITSGATSLVVNSAAQMPTVGNFRIIVDNAEIMLVTAVSGTTLTVVRGAEGTAAVAHVVGESVAAVFTAAGMQQVYRDYIPLVEHRPKMYHMEDKAGTPIDGSAFSWNNQTTKSVVNMDLGGLLFTVPRTSANNPDIGTFEKALPTTPYSVTAVVTHPLSGRWTANDSAWIGIGFRETGTSKLQLFRATTFGEITVTNYTNPTTSSSSPSDNDPWKTGEIINFIRIEDDGTNLSYHYSANGIVWQQIYTNLRTSHFTTAPDRVCIGVNSRWPTVQGSDSDYKPQLLHWSEA